MNKFYILLFILVVFSGCGGGSKSKEDGETRTYTVSFVTEGGSSMPARQMLHGSTLSEPAAPTRADYAFDGWHTDSARSVGAIFPMTVTGNITLYAKWRWTAGTEIRTASELNDVRNNLSGNYRLAADISLASYANWEPISSYSAPFTGKIDGNGHKITGLKIDRMAAVHAGLFGYVKDGEIINFTLENVDIAGGGYAGAIAGIIDGGTITGCSVSGKIVTTLLSAADLSSSGGVAGSVAYGSVITDCHNTAEIIADDDAGGIAGSVYDSEIINSSNSGNIFTFSESSGMSGGIAGYVDNGEIRGSFSSGDVVSYSYVSQSGGIAGGVTYGGIVTNSYSTGDIESYSDSDEPGSSVSGGIAGYVLNGTIAYSYSVGNNISDSSSGGIVGSSEGIDTITNSVAINGTINADHDAGRIVGYVFFPDVSTITDNFALEDMTATGAAEFDNTDAQRHGADKSDADLKKQTTYSDELDWKFGSNDAAPWQIPSGGYPMLFWE